MRLSRERHRWRRFFSNSNQSPFGETGLPGPRGAQCGVSGAWHYIISEGTTTRGKRSEARLSSNPLDHSSAHDVRIPALLYHHVGTPAEGAWPQLTISPRAFQRQMRWLALLHYTPIKAAEFLEWRRGHRPLPTKPVLLTFDDAYDDLPTHAFPVLQRYGFAAIVFVVTGQIGGANEWDVAAGWPRRKLMTREQICQWARHGLEFGSHTRSHPDLRACSESQIEQEIAGSRTDLEGVLNRPVISLAYPSGHHDQRVRACAQRSFELAFTCEDGFNDSATDHVALRRMIVGPERPWLNHLFRLYRGRNAPDLGMGVRKRIEGFWPRDK
jgi:peptidoglycan/xylan/chitin deacetylase (PgdA/CDA1 family)